MDLGGGGLLTGCSSSAPLRGNWRTGTDLDFLVPWLVEFVTDSPFFFSWVVFLIISVHLFLAWEVEVVGWGEVAPKQRRECGV